MKNKPLLILICLTLLISACGGGQAAPTAEAEPVQEETAVETETDVVETEATEMPPEEAEAAPTTETETEVAPEEEEPEEETIAESIQGFGDMLMSGVDPETGLEINPQSYGPGDTFIARGTIISMNLTPISSPEFLIESPDGTRYRVRTQALTDTYFVDGSQWQPFEFRQGVGAIATIVFDPSLSTSDIPSADDLVLVMLE